MEREELIYEEAAALWREVFGEAPPARAHGGELLDIITHAAPPASYERLSTPYLRAANITWPTSGPGSSNAAG
jgi:hypothetical protein